MHWMYSSSGAWKSIHKAVEYYADTPDCFKLVQTPFLGDSYMLFSTHILVSHQIYLTYRQKSCQKRHWTQRQPRWFIQAGHNFLMDEPKRYKLQAMKWTHKKEYLLLYFQQWGSSFVFFFQTGGVFLQHFRARAAGKT